MNIWISSMECAGIAEAGGVKNVTYSLCNEFSKIKQNVTLFIPIFKCTSFTEVTQVNKNYINDVNIFHCDKNEIVSYYKACSLDNGFNIVFIYHPAFYNKEAIYTYTENEQKLNNKFIKGTGHVDELFMDSLFAKAVCKYSEFIDESLFPDVIHCQDASTALIPSFAAQTLNLKKSKCVVTIHNAGPAYHHNFTDIQQAQWYTGFTNDFLSLALNNQKVEPFLLAHYSGAVLSTVSVEYANELTNPINEKETEGLSKIFYDKKINIKGITNGIDFFRYDPRDKTVSSLPYEFNPQTLELNGKLKCKKFFLDRVLSSNSFKTIYDDVKIYGNYSIDKKLADNIFIVYHGRITSQKGISVLLESIPTILNIFSNVIFIITGQGEISIESQIKQMCKKYTNKLLFLNGYSKNLARLTNAIGDFIVLPSFFEPCGLEDFISQIYGTLPIAHKTGGLNKILEQKTGFLYENNTKESLIAKISQAITIKTFANEKINKMIQFSFDYIQKNYLWEKVIKNEYLPFFKELLQKQ